MIDGQLFTEALGALLPLASDKRNTDNLRCIDVTGADGMITLRATNRFVAFRCAIECGGVPDFRGQLTIPAARAIKAAKPQRLTYSGDSIGFDGTFFPLLSLHDFPDIDRLIDEAWGDGYFALPTDPPEHAFAFEVARVKHIKGVEIIPRFDGKKLPTRILSPIGRGVMTPRRMPKR